MEDRVREDIIRMAREAGAKPSVENDADMQFLKSFAALVAEAEREACAKVCESLNEDFDSLHVESCAEAIRARGEK